MQNEKLKRVTDGVSACQGFQRLKLQYFKTEHRPGTTLLGESFVLKFNNEKSRSVQVIFHPRNENKDFFLINVVNTENNEAFNVEDWQKKYDVARATQDPFKLVNYAGTFSERLDAFIFFLDRLLSHEDLAAIIEGRRWENVSFDWAGMK